MLRCRRLTTLYPELLQIRVHKVYHTSSISDETKNQTLQHHGIAFISGVSLKNKTITTKVSNKILEFQRSIKTQGVITSTCHNKHTIVGSKTTLTSAEYNIVASSKQLDAIVVTVVDRRSYAFLGQVR